MTKNEIEILLSRIEGLQSRLEGGSLEQFQDEVLRVEGFLKRFGSLDELLSHLEKLERMAYAAKDFLSIGEAAEYLQISKSSMYRLTSTRELTVYKPNGKNAFIKRSDLNNWIKRNPRLSNLEIEKQARAVVYNLEKSKKQKKNNKTGNL